MRAVKYLYAFLLLTLVACVSMEAPRSFNERLAYGYGTLAAMRNTAASMLERGRITKEDGKKVQALADQARAALDVAQGVQDKDIKTAEDQLQLALTVLTQLEAFLKAKEGGS